MVAFSSNGGIGGDGGIGSNRDCGSTLMVAFSSNGGIGGDGGIGSNSNCGNVGNNGGGGTTPVAPSNSEGHDGFETDGAPGVNGNGGIALSPPCSSVECFMQTISDDEHTLLPLLSLSLQLFCVPSPGVPLAASPRAAAE